MRVRIGKPRRAHITRKVLKGGVQVTFCGRELDRAAATSAAGKTMCSRCVKIHAEWVKLGKPDGTKLAKRGRIVLEKRTSLGAIVPRCQWINKRSGHQCGNAASSGSIYCRIDHRVAGSECKEQ